MRNLKLPGLLAILFAMATLLLPFTQSSAKASSGSGDRQSDVVQTSKGPLKITPLYHATFLLEFNGKAIYFDPISRANYDGLPKADMIFLTDIHGDHMDPAEIDKLKKDSCIIVAPSAVAETVKGATVIGNGQTREIGGLTVEALPMYNIKRGPKPGSLYHPKGRGNGYVITIANKRIYVSGDTECTPEMKALKNIDVAFVCMNLPYTMPVEEAAECVKAFKPKIVYPYHYRGQDIKTFQTLLSSEKGMEVRLRDWYPTN